ncbi:hypothetical protein [Chroococcidiopsis sp. CCMEE 29]|uniref:hypothetical protein n=1 Tax=Chroococcidiopsis sp. CCMEE 29 TaxID=155894 RepID=UPI00202003C4|nr:hypothetical protein [Chroococcidiopsis sp. CCMEE 29]
MLRWSAGAWLGGYPVWRKSGDRSASAVKNGLNLHLCTGGFDWIFFVPTGISVKPA